MSVLGPYDIRSIVDRLGAVVGLKKVAMSADLATAMTSDAPVPSAFVYLAAEKFSAETRGSSGALIQQALPQIVVASKFRNYRASELGAQLTDDQQAIVGGQRDLLLGWMPAGANLVLRLVDAQLKSYEAATAWWIDLYETRYLIQKP